jgi:flagellar motility protein MotE (MotC chaperone)
MNDEQIDHLSKLNDRKKELDEREEELNRMEQELQAQKTELDKRMQELEGVRRGISSVLEEKVAVDSKKVDTLVLMYSDMKPPQAAKVFETMDEDLAVEILGRMKKKSAADIMNLLKPDKAQVLTEKFAGYKRK